MLIETQNPTEVNNNSFRKCLGKLISINYALQAHVNSYLFQTGFIFLRELCGTAVFTCIASMSHTNLLSAGLIYTALQASSEISR